MEVQTRTNDGALNFFGDTAAAFNYAEENPDVWKVSWTEPGSNRRIRCVRDEAGGWVEENLMATIAGKLGLTAKNNPYN